MQVITFLFRLFIIALPLIFISHIFNPYEFPKFIFFVTSSGLFAIFFALYWLFTKNKKAILPKIDLGFFLVLGFGITSLISDIFGANPATSIFGSVFRRQGFITLASGIIIFLLLRSPLLFEKILPIFRKTAIISAFLISLIALLQVIQVNMFHNSGIATYNGRIVGTLGNPNFLAGYLTMLLPFVLWYPQKLNKLLRLIIVFIIISTIFYTDSRAAYLAFILIFLIYVLRLLLKLSIPKITILFSIILIPVGLFLFTDLFIFKNTMFKDPAPVIKERGCPESWPKKYPLKIFTDIRNNIPLQKREAPCDNRLLTWTVGLETLRKQPLLGYGQNNFERAIPGAKMHRIDNAHNIFLETAISSGIIGLAFYVLILIYFLRKASFDIKMAILSFIIVGQFNPLSIAQIALFWILLGLSQKEKILNNKPILI